MIALDKVLSAIFCAVPAFSRVLPEITSLPVWSVMEMSAPRVSGAAGLLAMPIVRAPAARAASSAPIT